MNTEQLISKKGFTLIELLVVIAIIAILSTIGLVIFSGAQKNARDARRKSDVDSIAAALESKRTPGGTTYSQIVNTDFSAGAVPTDTYGTSGPQYCISTGAAAFGAPPAAWTTATCPNSGTAFTPAGGQPTGNPAYWQVCAVLETTPASVYCKNSGQ